MLECIKLIIDIASILFLIFICRKLNNINKEITNIHNEYEIKIRNIIGQGSAGYYFDEKSKKDIVDELTKEKERKIRVKEGERDSLSKSL